MTIPSIETYKKISCFAFVKMAKAGDFFILQALSAIKILPLIEHQSVRIISAFPQFVEEFLKHIVG